MAVPQFRSFDDVRRYLEDDTRHRLMGNDAPPTTLRAHLGAQYTDLRTGQLYVMESTGWEGPK